MEQTTTKSCKDIIHTRPSACDVLACQTKHIRLCRASVASEFPFHTALTRPSGRTQDHAGLTESITEFQVQLAKIAL